MNDLGELHSIAPDPNPYLMHYVDMSRIIFIVQFFCPQTFTSSVRDYKSLNLNYTVTSTLDARIVTDCKEN